MKLLPSWLRRDRKDELDRVIEQVDELAETLTMAVVELQRRYPPPRGGPVIVGRR